MARILSGIKGTSGTSAIEFAIVCPVLLALVFAIAFGGQMFFDRSTLQQAVEKTARDLAVNRGMSQSQMESEISGDLSKIGSPSVTVSYTTASISGTTLGHISASISESYTVPFINKFALTLNADTYVPFSS